jgi:hypothetical protein
MSGFRSICVAKIILVKCCLLKLIASTNHQCLLVALVTHVTAYGCEGRWRVSLRIEHRCIHGIMMRLQTHQCVHELVPYLINAFMN